MTLFDTILDSTLISVSCAYATWLRAHKEFEPHLTFAEVAAGVAYTLAFSYARGAYHGDSWRDQAHRTIRDFFISAPPIIVGELIQKIEERRESRSLHEEFPA